MTWSACVCRPGEQCTLECVRESKAGHPREDDASTDRESRLPYLLAELRCAAIRARLWQSDIEAVGLALKAGLVEPEQALELLADCHALFLVHPGEEADYGQ